MTDLASPPRLPQHLLGALGADADARDAVLGDLHELFMARAARDGVSVARGWYWGEALRTAPHLLVSGLRGQAWQTTKRTASAIALAYLTMLVMGTVVGGAIRGLVFATGVFPAAVVAPTQISWVALAMMLVTGTLQALIGGALAAHFDRHAPLRTAVVFATLWSAGLAVGYAVFMSGSGGLPLWFTATAPLLVLFGTATGGVLYLRRTQVTPAT